MATTITVTTGRGSASVEISTGARGPQGFNSISDTAYNATTWNGVTDEAPSKNAVRDKLEAMDATIVDPGTLEYTGSDPNVPENITVTGITDPADNNPLALAFSGYFNGKAKWGTLFSFFWKPDSGGTWQLTDGETYDANISSTAATSPVGLTGFVVSTGAGAPVITGDLVPLVGSYLGQWCKATTAWWQWDGTAWLPRFTLAGDPISYNATLSAFRKLVVSGADGSEVITISAL